jgi:hypothetical protein
MAVVFERTGHACDLSQHRPVTGMRRAASTLDFVYERWGQPACLGNAWAGYLSEFFSDRGEILFVYNEVHVSCIPCESFGSALLVASSYERL